MFLLPFISISNPHFLQLYTLLHPLKLSNTEVTDVIAHMEVHTLNLFNTKVTDVSGNVHTLHFI